MAEQAEMLGELVIPKFTYQDFMFSSKPYEWLSNIKSQLLKNQAIKAVEMQAKECKITGFNKLYNSYLADLKSNKSNFDLNIENYTNFSGQPIELKCGTWDTNGNKIMRIEGNYPVEACSHPIMPIARLTNIDTGIAKLQIAYSRGGKWKSIIVDRQTLASPTKIISLADNDIGVNSENARSLIKYLGDLETLNYDDLIEKRCVTRCGWIGEEGFSPWINGVEYDGEGSFKHIFSSIHEKGSFNKWRDIAIESRKNIYAKIILAASFASVLVKPLGCLPFFVHLWGGTEAGKTVALLLASSVWADPAEGKYWRTCKGTEVSQEKLAGFLNSMPLILDELQLIKDRNNFDSMIYMLAEGQGKSRGEKSGGLQRQETWANAIITSGEMPISQMSSGGGAINRIIEIECQEKLFNNGKKVSDILKGNYGFAGKIFVEWLENETNLEYARTLFNDFVDKLQGKGITDKQIASMSLIMTADYITTNIIFKDDNALKLNEVAEFLKTKTEIDMGRRAYDVLCDLLIINQKRFSTDIDENKGELWGVEDDIFYYIIKNQFNKLMQNEGFNPKAVLSWLKKNNLIELSYGEKIRTDKAKSINGSTVKCIWLKKQNLQEEEQNLKFYEVKDSKDMPF